MTRQRFNMEYVKRIYERYHQAGREEKKKVLNEICRMCGYHRKHAIRILNDPPWEKEASKKKGRRGRRIRYSSQTISVLAAIWEASGYLCSQRLKEALPHWVSWAKQRLQFDEKVQRELLRISPRQMDRRLATRKRKTKRRVYGTTKPGSLLKQMIPIQTTHWDVRKPGFLEIDLVSHSGRSAAGVFIHTLDATDIQTTWVERIAIMGKSERGVCQAMAVIERQLPFPLRGIDSDNGSEFINHHLYVFCRKRKGKKVQFTRSRPYKKDDNAHVEQKNWTHVRQLLGWHRYESEKALQAMNDIYRDLRIFQNLFQPSMKCVKKIRKGSRLLRKYDTAQTPFDRVLHCQKMDQERTAQLKAIYRTTDPFLLSDQIDHKITRICQMARRNPPKHPTPSTQKQRAWRDWGFKQTPYRKALRKSLGSFTTEKRKSQRKGVGSVTSFMA